MLRKIDKIQCLSGYILISSSFKKGKFATSVNVRLRSHREDLLTELPGSFCCMYKLSRVYRVYDGRFKLCDGVYNLKNHGSH